MRYFWGILISGHWSYSRHSLHWFYTFFFTKAGNMSKVCGFMLTALPSATRAECQNIAASEMHPKVLIRFERCVLSPFSELSNTFSSFRCTQSPQCQGNEIRSLSTIATILPLRLIWLTMHQNLSPPHPTLINVPVCTAGTIAPVTGRAFPTTFKHAVH